MKSLLQFVVVFLCLSCSFTRTICYCYDGTGNRISKTVDAKTTAYVRDALGNNLAVYENEHTEFVIYGSSRLGQYRRNEEFQKTALGQRIYEFSNHLGNVLVTLSDHKIPQTDGTYASVVVSASDYYPFGMAMAERTYSNSEYRYGFNGQEQSDELDPEGNSYTAEFWQYDARIGRRWNLDPLEQFDSYYVCFGNSPIRWYDPDGAWVPVTDEDGKTTLKAEEGDNVETLSTYFENVGIHPFEDEMSDWSNQINEKLDGGSGDISGLELSSERLLFDNLVGKYLVAMHHIDMNIGYVPDKNGYRTCSPTMAERCRIAIGVVYGKTSDEYKRSDKSTPEGLVGYYQLQNIFYPGLEKKWSGVDLGEENYIRYKAESYGLTQAMRTKTVGGYAEYTGTGFFTNNQNILWGFLRAGSLIDVGGHVGIFLSYRVNSKGIVDGLYYWDDTTGDEYDKKMNDKSGRRFLPIKGDRFGHKLRAAGIFN